LRARLEEPSDLVLFEEPLFALARRHHDLWHRGRPVVTEALPVPQHRLEDARLVRAGVLRDLAGALIGEVGDLLSGNRPDAQRAEPRQEMVFEDATVFADRFLPEASLAVK
jgi:hypothetical protein